MNDDDGSTTSANAMSQSPTRSSSWMGLDEHVASPHSMQSFRPLHHAGVPGLSLEEPCFFMPLAKRQRLPVLRASTPVDYDVNDESGWEDGAMWGPLSPVSAASPSQSRRRQLCSPLHEPQAKEVRLLVLSQLHAASAPDNL